MPKTLEIWEWGCPKRGDAQNAVTAQSQGAWGNYHPGEDYHLSLPWGIITPGEDYHLSLPRGLLGLGMGRTWQISGRICLPCGKNLSSGHIAKCDPKFSSWKKL